MIQVSQKTSGRIYSLIKKDLEPGFLPVFARIALAYAVGGAQSMFICGQFGIGFSEMATNVNHLMHHHGGPVVCSLFCGAVFSVLPVSLLRLSCSAILFRHITQRYRLIPAGILTGLAVIVYSNHGLSEKIISLGAWAVSGMLTYYLLSKLIDRAANASLVPSR